MTDDLDQLDDAVQVIADLLWLLEDKPGTVKIGRTFIARMHRVLARRGSRGHLLQEGSMTETAPRPIDSSELYKALCDAGVFIAEDRIRRIVIDLQIGKPVVIHVDGLGDERLLSLADILAQGTE